MYPSNRHVKLHIQQDGLCFYCRKKMLLSREHDHPYRACTIEHRIPRCRGGGGSSMDNIVGACGECNGMKGNLTDAEFLPLLKAANGNKGRLRELCMAAMYPECKLAKRMRGGGIDTYQRWRTRRESALDRAWKNILRAKAAPEESARNLDRLSKSH